MCINFRFIHQEDTNIPTTELQMTATESYNEKLLEAESNDTNYSITTLPVCYSQLITVNSFLLINCNTSSEVTLITDNRQTYINKRLSVMLDFLQQQS